MFRSISAKSKVNKSRRMNASCGDRVFTFLIYFFLSIFFLLVLLPLIYVVAASFSDPQAVITGKVFLWPVGFNIRGYRAVFSYHRITQGFANSFYYMILGTIINIVMTMLCAYPLSRPEFKARRILSVLILFTMIFSGGLIPLYIVVNRLGLVDTRWAMILPSAMSVWNVMIARTYISSSIPNELYEASEIDGCSPMGFFFRMVWPLSKPIIAVLVLYYGVGHWNSYFNALIFLRTPDLFPLQLVLRDILVVNKIDPTLISSAEALAARQGMQDLLKYSVIVVASLPVLLLYPFVQKHFVKGVMLGSLKG
ncbi:MAG: carbohydrate ABC transporter permease [Eubacteriales bacterium]|nr:carbohydrate ABC transporter permease [Eubacteriales bacterium]